MNCNSVKHLLSQTLKLSVAKDFYGLNLWIARKTEKLMVTENQISGSKIYLKYSYSSLKIFENKVVNKGKTDLADATHDLYTFIDYYVSIMITLNAQQHFKEYLLILSRCFTFFHLIAFFLIISFQTLIHKETSRL